MNTTFIDPKVADILPEDVLQYINSKETKLYQDLQAELSETGKKSLNELLQIMQEVESRLADSYLAEAGKNRRRDFLDAMARIPYA